MTTPWRVLPAGAVALLLLAGCGGSAPSGPTPPGATPAPSVNLGPVDPAAVGSWTGTIDGPSGPSTFTATLNADSSMSAEGTGNYCRVSGNWGVSAGQFSARGVECRGAVAIFTAPASGGRLTGTWTANNGARGTFDITK